MKKPQRAAPPEEQDPAVRFANARQEAANHGEWGQGESGYKSPKSPGEKMRKNVPYKVRRGRAALSPRFPARLAN